MVLAKVDAFLRLGTVGVVCVLLEMLDLESVVGRRLLGGLYT